MCAPLCIVPIGTIGATTMSYVVYTARRPALRFAYLMSIANIRARHVWNGENYDRSIIEWRG
jgi:hypothetical protein